MEKKLRKEGLATKSSSTAKILGNNSLQINEDDASHLVGGVVEKGFSDMPTLIQPPQPTVLSFPVARHRSHGPHWGPIGGKRVGVEDQDGDKDNEVDEDDTAFMEYQSVASFINPVPKPKKKGLDFSEWKELLPGDTSSKGRKLHKDKLSSKEPKAMRKDKLSPLQVDARPRVNSWPLNKHKESTASSLDGSFLGSDSVMELDDRNELDYKVSDGFYNHKKEPEIVPKFNQSSFKHMPDNKYGLPNVLGRSRENTSNMSLEREIHAENVARLEQMSAEEIAKEKAEIMTKLDSAVVKLLKRRGQDKLEKQSCLCSEVAPCGQSSNLQAEQIQEAKPTLDKDNDASKIMKNTNSKHEEGTLGNGKSVRQTLSSSNSFFWNAWSSRVEAVRDMRFSLDGTVLENAISMKSEHGDNSNKIGYGIHNVTERDFLRTEGDPGAAGYTIKEAVALTRSVVPAQRALALHFLSSVLDRALHNICKGPVRCSVRNEKVDSSVDWVAVWAYALGPEPELVLPLRMCLDDNHNSVILPCAKAIQCVLSCNMNESLFHVSEKVATFDKDLYTAPVFRSKPEVDFGFLPGGFWKYSAKPSNILPAFKDPKDEETEGQDTIQDDIVVAGQDFAAGFIRMEILPRLHYLLETNPTTALEECILSILIAIGRHSPLCANAIMKYERLLQTIMDRFAVNNTEIQSSMIKSVRLFKVLARSDKKNCFEFIKSGYFQVLTSHIYLCPSSIGQWVKLGKAKCELLSDLIVEQLRFWKACIQYGYCVSYFSDMFAPLCLWLSPPSFEKLTEYNLLREFASISSEAYLVLGALAGRLPDLFSQNCLSSETAERNADDVDMWSWSYVGPVVDMAMKWMATKDDPQITKLFEEHGGAGRAVAFQGLSVTPLLWVYGSTTSMLLRMLERVAPRTKTHVPWLPDFVPKIGLALIKYWVLDLSSYIGTERGKSYPASRSFIMKLSYLREQSDYETSLASVYFLNELITVIVTIDNLIQSAKIGRSSLPPQEHIPSTEARMLQDGVFRRCFVELRCVLNIFSKLVTSGWQIMHSIEMFGRGGPAPGVGNGWGSCGGGFWSKSVLLAELDSRLLIQLLEMFQSAYAGIPASEETRFNVQRINSALGLCLVAGPRDKVVVEKALDILFSVPAIQFLDLYGQQFLHDRISKSLKWQFKEEDYQLFSKTLASHFRSRWLSKKEKLKTKGGSETSKKGNAPLETIYEDLDMSTMVNSKPTSSVAEWAHQRLPLPTCCFLSPISTIYYTKKAGVERDSGKLGHRHDSSDLLEVAKTGLFFLLGIEAISNFQETDVPCPIQTVPLVWKLHSLSVNFLTGMELLQEERSREIFEALQDLYGALLDKARSGKRAGSILGECEEAIPRAGKGNDLEFIKFQLDIHDSYSTFIEELVEQYCAISYGDLIFGRQVSLYLHRLVEAPIRLVAWNCLSNAHVLELLPPIEKCFSAAEGYLEPVEDNEGILEAYVKSWVFDALDKAAIRKSAAYTLVVHHLSSFIFQPCPADKIWLQNKLAKSLLRDYSRKKQHESMILNLLCYNKHSTSYTGEHCGVTTIGKDSIASRLKILAEACDGKSSLLKEVEKLQALIISKEEVFKLA